MDRYGRAPLAAASLGALLVLASGCASEDRAPLAPTSGGGGPRGPSSVGTTRPSEPEDDPGEAGSGGGGGEAGSGASPDRPPASAQAFWDDAAGDVLELPGMLRYPVDVLSVSVEGVDGQLRVRFELDRTMAQHFAFPGVGGERTGGAPCELYLDLDDDPATGDAPIWREESEYSAELEGYEAEVDVLLGFDATSRRDGAAVAFGGDAIVDDDEYDVTGHWVDYWLIALSELPGSEFPIDTRDYAAWLSRTVELRIPYAWLGVARGDTLRAMYRENDQGAATGLGYSNNQRFTLR